MKNSLLFIMNAMLLAERLFYFTHGMSFLFFLFASIYLLKDKDASRLRKVLGYVVLFWFFLEVKDLFLYLSEAVRHTYFSNLLVMVDMLAVPVCTFYLFELLSPGWMNWKRAVVIELFLLVCIAGYVLTASELWMEVLNFYVIFYSIIVIWILRGAVNRYDRYIQTNYSNTERINVRWLRQVTFFMFLCLSVWMYSLIANSWFIDSLYYLSSMLLWGCILYYNKQQEVIVADEFLQADSFFNKAVPESLPDNFVLSEGVVQSLQKALLQDELFLNPKLTLTELATEIGTNRTYLSFYLNSYLHTTFYDYINRYRMDKVHQLLATANESLSMNEIAESSGFNSLSTFRRAFVKEFGMSFADYRKQKARF
ncbi:AraC family transcriptional regulator [Bacteroides pyogenes]|uniref:AraC family transcriptional regulator n=2 Tax=Bacteroides pyogenes TaxID=310300 RepID=A0A5D3EG37_9BACE|nr:AraC family transcriptional regulator [Bacteroides pyogenes]TYK35094.1 AraC family transcriptional regulator [Bacteroides pyogenes]TYK51684.1 AraC family transcriptional regulator [Bacteroides pyogenes]